MYPVSGDSTISPFAGGLWWAAGMAAVAVSIWVCNSGVIVLKEAVDGNLGIASMMKFGLD
jgi:divalent metal cation (Fe/Co/Zn/Cd) transporter